MRTPTQKTRHESKTHRINAPTTCSHLSTLAAMFAVNRVSPSSPAAPAEAGASPGNPAAEKEVVLLCHKGALDSCPPMLAPGMHALQPEFARVKLRQVSSFTKLQISSASLGRL